MRNILAVCKKELYTYFVSPIAYFVIIVFSALSGFIFSVWLITYSGKIPGADVMQVVFGNLTMKLFAEERKSGTIELLLTSPITDAQVVLGKFLASWILVLIMLGFTLLFPFLTSRFGPLGIGVLCSGYLGLILISSCFLAFGLLMSSMSKNQIVAALTSFGFFLTLWVIGILSNKSGYIGKMLSYLSFLDHYNDFARGVIKLNDVIYYLSFLCVCLFSTFKSIESSKWR